MRGNACVRAVNCAVVLVLSAGGVSAATDSPGSSIPAAESRGSLGDARFSLTPAEPEPTPEPSTKTGDSDEELAKKLANPVANLISIPFQFNYIEGYGPNDAGQMLLNIQPVVPFTLTEDWNLIVRTILPVVWQESPAPGVDNEFGLGDTLQSFFFSPKDPVGGWILGVGPAFQWPTATSGELGTGQWGVGPTAVALRQEGGWTYGILANHVWSFAGPDTDPDINATFLQPFLIYTWPTATGLGLNTQSTYDWNQSQWTVPINLFATQVVRLGKLPVQFLLGGTYYAESPDNGPEWGLRFQITILLPR